MSISEPPTFHDHDSSESADEVSYEEIHESLASFDDDTTTAAPPPPAALNEFDAVKVAALYAAKIAAADSAHNVTLCAPAPPSAVRKKVAKSASKPGKLSATARAKTPMGNNAGERCSSDPNQPHSTFNAQIRCAIRAGSAVWAGERDGCLVVRDASTGTVVERILSGVDWEKILCLCQVDKQIWAGSDRGSYAGRRWALARTRACVLSFVYVL